MGLVRIITYQDGSEARMHNKRVQFKQLEDGSYLVIMEAITDNPEVPIAKVTLKRDKLAQVAMKLSDDMVDAFVVAYVKYKEAKGIKVNFTPFNEP